MPKIASSHASHLFETFKYLMTTLSKRQKWKTEQMTISFRNNLRDANCWLKRLLSVLQLPIALFTRKIKRANSVCYWVNKCYQRENILNWIAIVRQLFNIFSLTCNHATKIEYLNLIWNSATMVSRKENKKSKWAMSYPKKTIAPHEKTY